MRIRPKKRYAKSPTGCGLAVELLSWCVACLGGFASSGAFAHHSPAAFDRTQEILFEGTVAKVSWKNPHIYLTLEIAGPGQSQAVQELEVGPIASLQALGLTRDALIVGERVSLRANPSRRGSGNIAMALDVTKGDGSVYPLHVSGRRSPPPVVPDAASLAGSWAPPPEAFMALFQSVPTLPLTEAARAASADRQSLVAAEVTCISYPVPMLALLSTQRTIEISDSIVTIRYDWMGAEQVIHLDQTEHPAGLAPSLHGHSIGWWDGEALVVDTVGFTPHRQGVAHGVPSSSAKHTVERLTLGENRRHIDYEITIDDSASLTSPITARGRWDYRPDLRATEPCDSEAARRFAE